MSNPTVVLVEADQRRRRRFEIILEALGFPVLAFGRLEAAMDIFSNDQSMILLQRKPGKPMVGRDGERAVQFLVFPIPPGSRWGLEDIKDRGEFLLLPARLGERDRLIWALERGQHISGLQQFPTPLELRIEELRQKYIRGLPDEIRTLVRDWKLARSGDGAAFDAFINRVHRIGGTAGTLGLSKLGVAAKTIERKIENSSVGDPETQSVVRDFLEDLQIAFL